MPSTRRVKKDNNMKKSGGSERDSTAVTSTRASEDSESFTSCSSENSATATTATKPGNKFGEGKCRSQQAWGPKRRANINELLRVYLSSEGIDKSQLCTK